MKRNNKNNMELILKYQSTGCQKARTQLLKDYLALITKIASKLEYDFDKAQELIQEGCIGFLTCLDRFKPSKGVFFSVYATKCIRGKMLEYLRKSSDIYSKAECSSEFDFKVLTCEKDIVYNIAVDEIIDRVKQQLAGLEDKHKRYFRQIYSETEYDLDLVSTSELFLGKIREQLGVSR